MFSNPGAQESEEAIKRHYADKANVYNFAMTCYEILTGQIPFLGVLYKEVYQYVMNGGRPNLPAYCPSLLTEYIKKCWHGDDKCKPSFQDICKVLRHVKLVLMRVNDPKDVSFLSVTIEFDYMELSNNLQLVSLSSCGGRSFKESANLAENQPNSEVAELEIKDSSPRTRAHQKTMQRVCSVLSFKIKSIKIEPKEDVMFIGSVASFIVQYSHHDLCTTTANFSETISEYGCVFWEVLSDDTVVAIKMVKVHLVADIR